MPTKTYNKCVINGTTYLDLSSDTVTADTLLEGYTAHDKNGAEITGTATSGGSVLVVDTVDSHGGTIREITAQNTVKLQNNRTITVSNTSQSVSPDTGYDGFKVLNVNPITYSVYYTGSSTPSSSLGVDGDVYLQT